MKIIFTVGTRPNFVKISPLISVFNNLGTENILLHTGQHYDQSMNKVFFDQLKLPKPDFFIHSKHKTSLEQIANIMVEFENVCHKLKPDLIIIPGDVNSSLACALTANKLNIPIAHIESGLRSFDLDMQEEINRIIIDRLSDYLFITESSANKNLLNEGIKKEKIFFVGNCMIDCLVNNKKQITKINQLDKLNLKRNKYVIVTIHRPQNVDSHSKLIEFLHLFEKISKLIKIVFVVHPRTKKEISKLNFNFNSNCLILDPLPYFEFLSLLYHSFLVLTDSGGIQEETTFLGKTCLTMRQNTERPVTIDIGTNELVGTNTKIIFKKFIKYFNGNLKLGLIPPKWDGESSLRISKIISKRFKKI